jgi:CRP-like cAMP-binding protein
MRQTHQAEDALHGTALFADVSRRHVRRLASISQEIEHPAGHVITAEGLGALAFHLVLSGEASVGVKGAEVRRLGPGDYFGEMSMIDGRPRSATVTALTPLRVLVVPHVAFEQLLEDEPSFAKELLLVLCRRLREVESTH